MSDDSQAIDTGAAVSVPDGEVTHEQLVKILEDARAADPDPTSDDVAEAPAATPPPKSVEPSVSARIIASRRAEMRAQQERQSIAADRAAAAKERAELAELTKVAEQVKGAKLSPREALKLMGFVQEDGEVDAKTFLETLANEHEPEAVARRVMTAEQAKTQALADEVKALRAERDADRFAVQRAEYQRNVHQVQSAFVDHVAAGDAYPHLVAEYPPDEIARAGWQVASDFATKFQQKNGRPPQADETPDDTEIAEYLERQAAARAEKRAAWHARTGKNMPSPSQGSLAIQGQPLKATSPRTLTNGASATHASPTKPWSQQDADAESRRILQQMYSEADE